MSGLPRHRTVQFLPTITNYRSSKTCVLNTPNCCVDGLRNIEVGCIQDVGENPTSLFSVPLKKRDLILNTHKSSLMIRVSSGAPTRTPTYKKRDHSEGLWTPVMKIRSGTAGSVSLNPDPGYNLDAVKGFVDLLIGDAYELFANRGPPVAGVTRSKMTHCASLGITHDGHSV